MEAPVIAGNPGAVIALPDLEAVSREAAELFALLSQAAIASQGRFTVAIPGGSTPRMLYSLLASERYSGAVDWKKAHLFWTDERIVPPDHPESNFRLAFETFLSAVPLPAENIRRIKGEKDAETAAREYEQDMQAFFGREAIPAFDLVILGVGADGHTASLFPGPDALKETKRLAVPVFLEKPEHDRVTLTLPVLKNAHHVLFLASGGEKTDVLHEILEGGNRKQYPAGLVRPGHGSVRWLLDKKAASKIHTT